MIIILLNGNRWKIVFIQLQTGCKSGRKFLTYVMKPLLALKRFSFCGVSTRETFAFFFLPEHVFKLTPLYYSSFLSIVINEYEQRGNVEWRFITEGRKSSFIHIFYRLVRSSSIWKLILLNFSTFQSPTTLLRHSLNYRPHLNYD